MRKAYYIVIALAIFIAVYVGIFATIVLAGNPLSSPFAGWPLWPAACTARGCVSIAAWQNQHNLAGAFHASTGQGSVVPEQSLTTTVRQHLVEHMLLRSPVNINDAQRYRENILHATTDEQIMRYMPLTLAEYDQEVLVPFLQQEALRAQHKVESTEELYKMLSDDRLVILLVPGYRWDTETGKVVAK